MPKCTYSDQSSLILHSRSGGEAPNSQACAQHTVHPLREAALRTAGPWGCLCKVCTQRPKMSWLSRDHPKTTQQKGRIDLSGKKSGFRQQSGIFSVKHGMPFA